MQFLTKFSLLRKSLLPCSSKTFSKAPTRSLMHIDGSALSLSLPPAKVLATNDDEEFAIEHGNTTAAVTVEKNQNNNM